MTKEELAQKLLNTGKYGVERHVIVQDIEDLGLFKEITKLQGMCMRAYMDANKIPYQTVGDSNIENIKTYLCEKCIMPAHMVPGHLVNRYGLIDAGPSLQEIQKKTKELQKLANKKRNPHLS